MDARVLHRDNPIPGKRERRREKRYPVRPGAFASVHNHSCKMGEIEEISRSGLSFRYVATEDKGNDHSELDIFTVGSDFLLRDLPVRIISDRPILEKIPFSTVTMRQHRVQFLNMTRAHADKIDWFVRHHAMDAGE